MAEAAITLQLALFKDYDKSSQTTSFDASVTQKTSTSVWDTAAWDSATWAAPAAAQVAEVIRLPTLGTAKAISLRVNGPLTDNTWEVNALAFTYTPRRLR